MPGIKNNIYKYTVSCSGLLIELLSDHVQLLGVNFLKKEKIYENDLIPDPVRKAAMYLDDYFIGKKSSIKIIINSKPSGNVLRNASDKLYLDLTGYTDKEICIYKELLKVESGKTISYNELAERSGIPRGARFAGNCMAANRFPVIIPCHRVIRADGLMGNYTGGVEIKKYLLEHEKSVYSGGK